MDTQDNIKKCTPPPPKIKKKEVAILSSPAVEIQYTSNSTNSDSKNTLHSTE